MKLYRMSGGAVIEKSGTLYRIAAPWDEIFRAEDPRAFADEEIGRSSTQAFPMGRTLVDMELLSPAGGQEVWAAGVTYYRSRDARMEESQGGGDFYARVYEASRPELFFKSTGARVRGPGQSVRVRGDSKWNVPEPELTLAINSRGRIIGYTIGNDVSSRDIEGENPLYLPQAKVYDGSCALGPCVLCPDAPLGPDTTITLEVMRAGGVVWTGSTTLAQLKRKPEELVGYLTREMSFPDGVFLMTGTGVVPPADFSLQPGDDVRILITGVGLLSNAVE